MKDSIEPALADATANRHMRWSSWLRGVAAALAVIGGITLLILAFAWPWLPRPGTGADAISRYAPLNDGDSTFVAVYSPGGQLVNWKSSNLTLASNARALAVDLRPSFREAINKLYRKANEATLSDDDLMSRLAQANGQIYQTRIRVLDASGHVTETIAVGVRETRGDFYIGLYLLASNQDILYDPPALTPADLHPGAAWESHGRLGGVVDYALSGNVRDAGPFENALGRLDDCITMETSGIVSNTGQILSTTSTQSHYCAGIGSVEAQQFTRDPSTSRDVLTSREVLISALPRALPASMQPALATLPIPSLVDVTTNTRQIAVPLSSPDWQLARLARTCLSAEACESTISPVWIPTDPPLVLAAASNGDLVAYDARDPNGAIAWRTHLGHSTFSPPAYDAGHNRIFLGVSDKRLVALDAHGLFLWSFATGDNVAAQPVVVSDTVIFGSEDRNIYAVNANTGELKWKVTTGGAVVSSPAIYRPARLLSSGSSDRTPGNGSLVIIGSDDGGVYGLDIASGQRRWLFTTGGPVEAPIVVSNGVAYVASRDRSLYTLSADTGELIWQSGIGSVFRTAPAVSADRVFVVDTNFQLSAFDRLTGQWLWTTPDDDYTGPPLLMGDNVLVAGADGRVFAFNAAGRLVQQWSLAQADNPAEASGRHAFAFGPTPGEHDAWLADNKAVVWHLSANGAAQPRPQLRSIWAINPASDAPFDGFLLSVPLAPYGSQAVVLDAGRNIYLVDPATGQAIAIGRIAADKGVPYADPVVANNTLLSVMADTLYANSLPDGKPLWQFKGDGIILRSPLVVTTAVQASVLVLTWRTNEQGPATSGTLSALDLASGAVRWQASVNGFFSAGNAIRAGASSHTIYISTPPAAYDVATGQLLWQAHLEGGVLASGGPALSESGNTLFVAVQDPADNTSMCVAIDTASGRERWRTSLGENTLSAFESLWVSGDSVIVPSAGGRQAIIALDAATGAERWRYQPSVPRFGAITVAQQRVWVLLQNGRVLALDPASGKLAALASDIELDLQTVRSIAQRPLVLENRVMVPAGTRLLGWALEDK